VVDPLSFSGIFLFIAAFAAGFVDSVAGGGGLIQVPALFAVNLGQPAAGLLANNKVASIGGTLIAAKRYLKYVKLEKFLLTPAILFSFFGSFGGAWAVTKISSDLLRMALPFALAGLLVYTIRRPSLGGTHEPVRVGWVGSIWAGLIGLVIGFYDGFFGPGTGTFLLIGFVRFFGFDFLHASAAAKMVNITTNLAAILMFGSLGYVDWSLGLFMMSANMLGSFAGTHFALKYGNNFVRRIFVYVVFALIIKTGYDAFKLAIQ